MRNAALNIIQIIFILSIWVLQSCGQKKICPAYQSVFYLNSELADADFSYFDADSMPKIEHVVKKTDVLLIVKQGKKKRERMMATIPMITIFPEMEDSLLAQNDQDEMYDEIDPDAEVEQAEPEYDDEGNLMPPRKRSELPPDDPEISDKKAKKKDKKPASKRADDADVRPKEEELEEEPEKDEF